MSQQQAHEQARMEEERRRRAAREKMVSNLRRWGFPVVGVFALGIGTLSLLGAQGTGQAGALEARATEVREQVAEAEQANRDAWSEVVRQSSGLDTADLDGDAEADRQLLVAVLTGEDLQEKLYAAGIDGSTQFASEFVPAAQRVTEAMGTPQVHHHAHDLRGVEGGLRRYVSVSQVADASVGEDPAPEDVRWSVVFHSTTGDGLFRESQGYWAAGPPLRS